MDLNGLIQIANSFAALGTTGILGLLFILWLTGKIHTNNEKEDWEKLREEAVTDRRTSDAVLKELSSAIRDNTDIMRRSIELTERILDDYVPKN